MTLYVKNMVCDRCKMVVADLFDKSDIPTTKVDLGVVETSNDLDDKQTETISQKLQSYGFELLDDKRKQMVHIIKTTLIELVQTQPEKLQKINPSTHISEKVGRDYKYLSTLFSEVEGTTIEQFLINQKIEKVKELLVYDEYSLSQIADLLYYSSVQHLSTQFKKVTGLTPSHFKQLKENKRISINQI
ncbi:transcriptional regulator, AraC family [Emticicia oligotrophica DSM 17448]|uniref:Transcriptional regulator, AraC family n=1 Tax=Emticicia oligotrophica (strain DSM 17448 / CIP 109782 / MTCC 6937 / GPTSA100-15) TaxID=929562 RepID=A0ABN4AQ65_EMTOG|nr:AraC family transcriptional regulator [Emticicia oligotrophica]AFK04314.1 transcriptional regulator, AraC family [Emticicia oligotrophica DSM 17448]